MPPLNPKPLSAHALKALHMVFRAYTRQQAFKDETFEQKISHQNLMLRKSFVKFCRESSFPHKLPELVQVFNKAFERSESSRE